MATVTLHEAQERLVELVENLAPGDAVVITRDERPVARLVGEPAGVGQQSRRLGTLAGTVTFIAPDFDAPLDEFRAYIP
jgi:antitoxin (DNA-binding transcriptional repressor) of toxin-antitoxin stability system